MSAPDCAAAYFQRWSSSRLMPVRSESLSISSAYSAVLFVTASSPPTAADAPPTMAVPHFAAVLMPLPSLDVKLSAFSSVFDIDFSASAVSINMLPNKRNSSILITLFRAENKHPCGYFRKLTYLTF